MSPSGPKAWIARWCGLISIGGKQAISRATYTARQRALLSILGVAVVISLLVVVTALGLGLATSTTVYDDDIDYWIVPDAGSSNSVLIDTGGPAFSDAHGTARNLEDHPDVAYVSPIMVEVLQVESGDRSEYLLVIGVVSSSGIGDISGVDAELLSLNDPGYGDPEARTGEMVLSESAATLLEVSENATVSVEGRDSFTVTGIDAGQSPGGTAPVALVQLSELQALTGGDEQDLADQFVVGTNSPAVKDELEDVYPQSSVHSRAELTAAETMDAELPLALSVTAFIVSVAIGALFVTTMLGLELLTERQQLVTLSALGLSTASHIRIITVQTLLTTALGGLLGGIGGLLGAILLNEGVARYLGTDPIALVHPLLAGYGFVVAIVIGMVTLPWLWLVTRRVARGVPR